jgi:hypothetical protein
MEIPPPTAEHNFLLQLVGEWTLESECVMGPDQPPHKTIGRQSTRALGSFWTLGEMETPGSDGESMISLITLGFDPNRKRFVGSFISSCMSFFWLYDGALDDSRRVLTLNAEGPSFVNNGSMTKYQDIIEVVDENTYLFRSQYQNDNGEWVKFMSGKHSRIK